MENLSKISEILEKCEGYQVGLTVLKEGNLTTYLFTEKFPLGDMLKSNIEVKKLIIAELEGK